MLGEVAERALARRQFYVGNTRFRGSHRIYVSHREAILARLAAADPGRELATEFLARHRVTRAEQLATRSLWRLGERARLVWLAMLDQLQRTRQAMQEKVGV